MTRPAGADRTGYRFANVEDKTRDLLGIPGQEYLRCWNGGEFVDVPRTEARALEQMMRTGTWAPAGEGAAPNASCADPSEHACGRLGPSDATAVVVPTAQNPR